MLKKILKHASQGTLLKSVVAYLIIKTDEVLFVNNVSFEIYYDIQKKFNFPIQKLQFYNANRYFPDLKNPKSFNEKCCYSKLLCKNDLLVTITDKHEVRDYVLEKIKENILIPQICVAKNFDDINFDILPQRFVLKTNFSSGQNIIVKNKNILNIEKTKKIVNKWMKNRYRVQELIWFPQCIDRKIIIEEFICDESGDIPVDYKFYVFNGVVRFINVISDRFKIKKMSFYDRNWNFLTLNKNNIQSDSSMEKPILLGKMIHIAEKLGKDFNFIRVDLYNVNSKIYFGELTPYPGDGRSKFDPIFYDYEFGKYWDINLSHKMEKL
ncbi:TupA-like ATPgrasp [Desulfomicrobium apsheronum]|uniref:TupA-like ATPgrasp n=1 Tax=Desulfomicrobium apsheronum TaxID=52560 RepID=A0A1I3VYS4_9BACT|nr:ATP-grasp fold amidoligase family protein [Desulfomicrobium apsheronum]SFJ99497.1 TupA-like ATPgrasp [Desulfomicrobium apsheronum]